MLIVMLVCSLPGFTQDSREAAKYMDQIGVQYKQIQKENWDYTRAVAHSRSARKVERKRTELLKILRKAKQSVKSLSSFKRDYSLRDSVVAYFDLSFTVINEDYEKIMDMEAVAEQSYDLMEAYLLAQEIASEKLEKASLEMEQVYKAFAEKYGVNLIENKSELDKKLEKSSEALKYYNQVYLVFFKAYKQEMYLLDAMERTDINAIEQNRNALISVADEGLEKLKTISTYKGDNSINNACRRMLTFYKDEAENKVPVLADFLVKMDEFKELDKLFKSKDRMQLTKEEVDKYNKAVDEHNSGITKFNNTNNSVNSKRETNVNAWNTAVEKYMTRHIPKR